MTRILLLIALFIFPSMAQADYFVWQDPKSGLSLSYPDTWERQNNRHVDTVLSVVAPSNSDNPVCDVKVSDDKRYTIFPPEYGDAVQRDAVSIPFWKSYMGNYDEYEINKVYDGAGLGRWHASYATASYTKRNGTQHEARRGIMFASLYYDQLFIVECSTLAAGYGRWHNNFRSFIKSIDFKKIYNERAIGEYHDFLKNADLYFWAQTGREGTTRY
jgi:hypothetical protein